MSRGVLNWSDGYADWKSAAQQGFTRLQTVADPCSCHKPYRVLDEAGMEDRLAFFVLYEKMGTVAAHLLSLSVARTGDATHTAELLGHIG